MLRPSADDASSSPADSVIVPNPPSVPRPTEGARVVMRSMAAPVARGVETVTARRRRRRAQRGSRGAGGRRRRRRRPGETQRGQTRPRGAAPTGAALHDNEGIAMATLCRAYTTEQDAHAAVDRLLTAGVSGAEVRVLMGDAVHDSRDAPVGGFAGMSTAARETVGSYAGLEHSGREAMGSFTGDAEEQRRGGFRDVDREAVNTNREGGTHAPIPSQHNLEQMPVEAGPDEATATSD